MEPNAYVKKMEMESKFVEHKRGVNEASLVFSNLFTIYC